MITITLMDAPIGKKLVVEDVLCGHRKRSVLSNMGILPGAHLIILRRGAIGGPILIDVEGTQVAVGRGVASKIEVKAA